MNISVPKFVHLKCFIEEDENKGEYKSFYKDRLERGEEEGEDFLFLRKRAAPP